MKTMYRKQVDNIEVGDSIVVVAQGYRVKGTVISVSRWGDDMGWYIEMDNANVPGGYSYWKQYYDGGYIVEHNGKEVK